MMTHNKLLIGSEEWFSFTTLGIPAIKARVDSGAKTSSIHAVNIAPFKRKGSPWVSFEVHPLQNNRRTVVRCEAPVVDRRSVRSSSGDAERRFVICVPMSMGDNSWDVEVTLANRDSMGYRMLLGREAMVGRMLVDPGSRFIHGDLHADALDKAYGGLGHGTEEGLQFGLLASDPELYTSRRIVEAAEERGHNVHFLDIKHCYMKLDTDAPEIHHRGAFLVNELDAVIPRIPAAMTLYGCALTRQFENMNIYCLNGSAAIGQSRDQLFSCQVLQKNGLEIPVTGFADSPIDTGEVIDMVGGAPLIVKLLEGTQGRGAVLAETRKAAESTINALKSVKANILVQEYVKEARGKSLRCLVIDGKVVVAVERRSNAGEFRMDTPHDVRVAVVKATPDEKRAVVKAAKVLDLRVASVDLLRADRGPLLLKVNPVPDLEDLETATNRDLAGMLISSIEQKLGWKRKLAAEG